MGYYFYGGVILWDFVQGKQKAILSGLLKKQHFSNCCFPSLWDHRRTVIRQFLSDSAPTTGLSEPQPPSGLCHLSRNHQQVPGRSYINTRMIALCEDREHVHSSFAAPALSLMACTEQTEQHLFKELMSE